MRSLPTWGRRNKSSSGNDRGESRNPASTRGLGAIPQAFIPFLVVLLVVPVLLAGCGRQPSDSGPSAIRLVDLFGTAEVQAGPDAPVEAPPQRVWSFEGASASGTVAEGAATNGVATNGAATMGWVAGGEVSGLAVRDGLLVGSTTGDFPFIHTRIEKALGVSDLVYSVEVRASVTKGDNLGVAFQDSEAADPSALKQPYARLLTAPLLAGEGMQTYTIRSTKALRAGGLRHLLLRPSDVEGADFEVESVRVVTLAEHLAETPMGVGWYGLSEVYKESIAAKAPVTARFEVSLQEHPRLDVAIGTIEEGPVTFRVGVRPADPATVGEETMLLEQRAGVNGRWEPVRVDLAAYAGQDVVLTLSVAAEKAGAVGFWGSPVLHNGGAVPAVSPAAVASGVSAPQGVILIVADSLRRDHLNAYGYERETAPVLARMASEGALFLDCVSQATSTEASIPSILTSMYPTAHTVQDVGGRLPSTAQTLAEVYREAGYATLSMSSAPSTGQFSNLHQGFETLHECESLGSGTALNAATEFVDRLLPWLREHRDVPFFVSLHVSCAPDVATASDFEWADSAKRSAYEGALRKVSEFVAAKELNRHLAPIGDELNRAGVDTDAFASNLRDLHDDSIRAVDAAVGQLLEGLHDLGLREKTVVAFVGAHGEEFLDHNGTCHGHSVYGELVNVPLIVVRPGTITAGNVIEGTVQTIDVMPTLLEMSGLELPENAQGVSLFPLLVPPGSASAAHWTGPPAVMEKAAGGSLSPNGEWEAFAIIADGWKLIQNGQRADGKPEFELYNHRDDPLDQADVAAGNAELVERLSTELAGWRERALSARLSSDAEAMSDVSSDELKRLESLGYL